MDRRSWLWRRKSSEKSPGETESSGSLSSHSERFSDDQRSQSPEITSKAVTREEDGTEDVKILTERLSAALLNVSLKEDLAKQHAKVAEEAVTGWEKAEKEAVVLKQQLDDSLSKNLALEDRNSHLDSALKECVRQLRQGREEQDQKIQEWDTKKSELEGQIKELQARLITNPVPDAKLDALEKENSALKLQLLSKAEEIEIRTIERDLSTQAAESASKQQLEGIKKLTKLEAECRKLRVMVRRSASSKELKSSMDNQTDNCEKVPFSETDMQSSSEKAIGKTSVSIGLMDDFLEMEKLAAQPQSEAGRNDLEKSKGLGKSSAESSHLKQELEASVHRISELEEKVEMVEVEKVQLEMALDESRKQIDALQTRLMETERKLSDMKKLELENQDLELSLEKSRKELEDLQRQLNKAQVNSSEFKKLEVENHDLELSLVESGKQIEDLERELSRAQVSLSELETIRAEKLELTICLNGTKKELETTENRVKESERKLTELQTLLHLTKDAKEAAEDGVKAANAKTEAVEARLKDVEAEVKALTLKIESLEQNTEQERALSATHISKCEELQSEISRLKHELEHNQEPELKPHHFKGFDEDFKLKQEKELAMAASKFADCQRTIASLGQRLQSLAVLEDFLVES